MDGVLVDSGQLHFDAWQWLAESRGGSLTREQFLPTFGMRNADAIRRLFGDVAEPDLGRMSDAKEEEFRRMARGALTALPGAEALVRALHADGRLQAVASSSPRENIRVILEALGLDRCFQATASGEDVSNGKPNPEIFTLAAHRLAAPPLDCIVVEDAVVGVQAGVRAGMTVFAVTNTRKRDELSQADRVVDSLAELTPADFVLPKR